MYWSHESWSEIAEGDCVNFLKELTDKLRAARARKDERPEHRRQLPPAASFVWAPGTPGDGGGVPKPLRVWRIRVRRPGFYRKLRLAELACEIREPDRAAFYSDGRAFVLFSDTEAWLIDWTSRPIHWLNQEGHLQLAEDNVAEYLDFFCGFIQGSEGPFTLIQDESELQRDANLKGFGSLVKQGRPQDPHSSGDPYAPDTPDCLPIGQEREAPEEKRQEPAKTSSKKKSSLEEIASDASSLDERSHVSEHISRARLQERTEKSFLLTANVLYGRDLFASSFQVNFDGMVIMTQDKVAMPELRVLAYRVMVAQNGVRLLVTTKPRRVMQAARLRHEIASGGSFFAFLRVPGDLDLRAVSLDHPLELDDVEIEGSVCLDESRVQRSIRFVRSKVLGTFSARNASIDGSISLADSMFFAIGDMEVPLKGMDLSGLRVERDLDATNVVVYGRPSASSMRVGGNANFNGFDWRFREDKFPKEFDLSFAEVRGTLDLSPHLPPMRADVGVGRRAKRSQLPGPLNGEGVHAAVLNLRGGRLHKVCLNRSRIGLLEMGVANFSVTGESSFRTWAAALELDGAHLGQASLKGLWVHGYAHLSLTADRSIFWGTDWNGFRSGVGGMLYFSGSKVAGDIDLDGFSLEHDLMFITGEAGRFFLRPASFQVDAKEKTASFVRPRVNGIAMQGVRIRGDAAFDGTRITGKHPSYASGRFLGPSLRVEGSLSFWRERVRETLEFRLPNTRDWSWANNEAPRLERFRFEVPGNVELAAVTVGVDLDLSNARVGGQIRLDDAHVEADLNARSRVPAGRDESSRLKLECARFQSRMAKVGGDADLTGLVIGDTSTRCIADGSTRVFDFNFRLRHEEEVQAYVLCGNGCNQRLDEQKIESVSRGNGTGGSVKLAEKPRKGSKIVLRRYAPDLDARNAVFGGELRLAPDRRQGADAQPSRSESRQASVDGTLILAAASSSHTVVSGASFRKGPEPISLERARFGRLQIQKPFPLRVDLANIVVERWEMKHSDFLALLERAHPFERSTYADVERMLRNEGDERVAAQVYRAMRDRELDPNPDELSNCWLARRIEALIRGGETPTCDLARWRKFILTRVRRYRRRPWAAAWAGLVKLTTGYWTQTWRMFVAIVVTFLVAVYVFRANTVAERTTGLEAVLLAVNYSVPLVDLPLEGIGPALRSDGPLMLDNPVKELCDPKRVETQLAKALCKRRFEVAALNPSQFAFIVAGLGWLFWPLFLLGFSGIVRGRKENS